MTCLRGGFAWGTGGYEETMLSMNNSTVMG